MTLDRSRLRCAALAALSCGALATSALGCEATQVAPTRIGGREGAVVNGVPDRTRDAVVYVSSSGGGCSGTVIAPRIVLTAAHCFDAGRASPRVTFGPSPVDLDSVVRNVIDIVVHPSYSSSHVVVYDVALLTLDADAPVPPVALPGTGPDTVANGQQIQIVGYGRTSYADASSAAERRTGVAYITAVRSSNFHTQPHADGAVACYGDSGGAALAPIDGVETLVGVTSTQSGNCREGNDFVRVSFFVRAFIQPYIDSASERMPAPPPPCGDVTEIGRCDGNVLSYCVDGGLATSDCGVFRCDLNADGLPECMPPTADAGGAGGDCGTLDAAGECAGAVARWCQDGHVLEHDCAADGQACGFVGDSVGYYCVEGTMAPPPGGDPCAAEASTCGACTALASCGWCQDAGTCSSGSSAGPISGSCAAWSWNASECSEPAPPPSPVCDEGSVACDGGSQCIPTTWICDGVADCADESDEIGC